MKYLSNLNRLDFDGKLYDQGDQLTVNDDNRGAADILVKWGRATLIADGDARVTTNGDSSNPAPGTGADEGGETGDQPALSGMTKAELLDTARSEGVDGVTEDNNKSEIVDKIEAARRR